MSLHRSPHESVITVSFVPDEAVMPSAVTVIRPPQETTVNTEWIWQLTFTQKHLSVTHDLSDRHAFQPVSCLFSLFNLPNRHNLSFIHFLEISVTLFCSSWVESNFTVDRLVGLLSSPHRLEGLWSVSQHCGAWQQGEQSAMFDVKGKLPCSV